MIWAVGSSRDRAQEQEYDEWGLGLCFTGSRVYQRKPEQVNTTTHGQTSTTLQYHKSRTQLNMTAQIRDFVGYPNTIPHTPVRFIRVILPAF